jgi:hypothetical protein
MNKTAVAENVSADQARIANLTPIAAQAEIAIRKHESVLSAHLVQRMCVAALSGTVIGVTPFASSAGFASNRIVVLIVLGRTSHADPLSQVADLPNAIYSRCLAGSIPMAITS